MGCTGVNMLKEPAPSLAAANDRHTKKVKIRDQLSDANKNVNEELVDADNDIHIETMDLGQDSEERVSFRDKLMGNTGSSKPTPTFVEFEFQEQDVKMGMDNDIPTINFSERVKGILAHSMDRSVIVKLLGKTIGSRHCRTELEPYGSHWVIFI